MTLFITIVGGPIFARPTYCSPPMIEADMDLVVEKLEPKAENEGCNKPQKAKNFSAEKVHRVWLGPTKQPFPIPHRIHVWYIYLHLKYILARCR